MQRAQSRVPLPSRLCAGSEAAVAHERDLDCPDLLGVAHVEETIEAPRCWHVAHCAVCKFDDDDDDHVYYSFHADDVNHAI